MHNIWSNTVNLVCVSTVWYNPESTMWLVCLCQPCKTILYQCQQMWLYVAVSVRTVFVQWLICCRPACVKWVAYNQPIPDPNQITHHWLALNHLLHLVRQLQITPLWPVQALCLAYLRIKLWISKLEKLMLVSSFGVPGFWICLRVSWCTWLSWPFRPWPWPDLCIRFDFIFLPEHTQPSCPSATNSELTFVVVCFSAHNACKHCPPYMETTSKHMLCAWFWCSGFPCMYSSSFGILHHINSQLAAARF